MSPPTHLIVLCCHGIWQGGPSAGKDEEEWLIADFQRGETPTFIEHIKAGVEFLAREGTNATLAFSGGRTRKETYLSEAESYLNIAREHGLYFADNSKPGSIELSQKPSSSFGDKALPVTLDQILLETRALDSYHNILFSLTLYYTRFHTWPLHLTIVSHAFKKPRLQEHCKAIGWPEHRTSYVGIDPPGMAALDLDPEKEDAQKGVLEAVGDWLGDPHGRGEKLRGKRRKRNPWETWQGIFPESCEDVESSGLKTAGKGDEETLVDDAPRPWG